MHQHAHHHDHQTQPCINQEVYNAAAKVLGYDKPTMWLKFLQKDAKTRGAYNTLAALVGARQVDIPEVHGLTIG